SFSHLALSGAGGELAVVGEDKSIWVLDALTGKSKSTLKRPDVDLSVNSVQFSADDKKIIVAHDSNIVVWDKSGGSATTIRPGNSRVDWAVPAPDGKLLAVSLAEHKAVYLWDIDKGLLVDRLNGHKGLPTKASFFDKNNLFTTDTAGAVIHWDMAVKKP